MSRLRNIATGMLAGILLAAAVPVGASANLIDTAYGAGAGSFELGIHSGAAFDSLAPGSTTITGWTVGGPGDGVDWLNEPSFNASDGVHSVDLQTFTASSISTVISTVIGQTYQLTFDSAAILGLQGTGTVSAGTLTGQSFAPPTSPPGTFSTQTYSSFAFLFDAVSTSTTLTFSADATCCGGATYGPMIDNVSIVETSTEVAAPGAFAILGLGLAVLGFVRRR
ncbi:MAG: DUF642 domain-containing protein [Alphaproteobacteria bacterium]